MIFNDVMFEKQGSIEKYFCQGRHGGADCFHLTQNYLRIPKQVIRDNADLVVLFNQNGKNMRSIYDAIVGGDMPFDEFRPFVRRAGPWNTASPSSIYRASRITASTDAVSIDSTHRRHVIKEQIQTT